MTRFVVAALFVAACGGEEPGGSNTDAQLADTGGGGNTVVEVTCPTTADAMIAVNSGGTAFVPANPTVPVGAVVKFFLTADHDVQPNPLAAMTDPGIVVGEGKTACLKFTAAGTFGFYCMKHSFVGTITVQ